MVQTLCSQAFSHNGDPCVTPDKISQTVLFPDLFDKPLVATFNREQASSDGGAVLLKAAERVYGLVKAFARCLADKRAPEKIRHTLAELIGQRIFGIACGHPDGNDADHLAEDPIHKLLLGRDPVAGAPLASQPTISRFENAPGRGALYRMARELAASVIERHRRRLHRRVWRITIDLDPTDDRTHGAQQLTFFNGHYDSWCYLPLLAFLTFNDEKEQYLCAAVLRPGKAVAADGTLSLLCRLLPMLRAAFPSTRFLVRLDGGFATPEILDFLDAEPGLDYVVAMGKNAVLQRHAESAMAVARAQSEASGRTEHVYTDTRYAAGTWGHQRRVVIKAEVVRLKGREPRGQSALRRDESLAELALRLRVGLLRPRGHREPDQGVAGRPADRPHELLQVPGEPVARVADRGGLRTHAGAAAAGGADRLCPHPSDVAARPAAEAGGACRRLRAPHRPASTTGDAPSPRLAAHRARARRPRGSVVSAPRGSAHVSVPGGTAVPAELSPNLASATARRREGPLYAPCRARCHVREAPLAVNKPRRCLILDPHE